MIPKALAGDSRLQLLTAHNSALSVCVISSESEGGGGRCGRKRTSLGPPCFKGGLNIDRLTSVCSFAAQLSKSSLSATDLQE